MNDTATALIERLSFTSGLQMAWDSTSLGALKTCPRLYQLSIVEGWQLRGDNIHLTFGIEFHAALELYDHQRAAGASHNDALHLAIIHVLHATWRPDLGRPWLSDEPTKNRHTLLRAVVWYLDQFQDDPLETIVLRDGKAAVELSFRFELEQRSRLTGEYFLLCGHIDRLARWQGKTWVVDRKTTKSTLTQEYFDRYTPDNQVSLYTLAGGLAFDEPIAGLIIDAGQTAVNFTRFQRQPISRTPAQLQEWHHDLSYWLSLAESFAEAGYYPQNDRACHNYGGCQFRGVCAASPEVREKLLQAQFTKRLWDPLRTREI